MVSGCSVANHCPSTCISTRASESSRASCCGRASIDSSSSFQLTCLPTYRTSIQLVHFGGTPSTDRLLTQPLRVHIHRFHVVHYPLIAAYSAHRLAAYLPALQLPALPKRITSIDPCFLPLLPTISFPRLFQAQLVNRPVQRGLRKPQQITPFLTFQ